MADVAHDGCRSFDGNHTMSGAHFFDVPECVYQQGSSHVGQRKKNTHTHFNRRISRSSSKLENHHLRACFRKSFGSRHFRVIVR